MADSVLFNSGNPDWYEYDNGDFAGSGAFTIACVFKPAAAMQGAVG